MTRHGLIGLVLLSTAGPLQAQVDTAKRRGPVDPAEIEAFVDGMMLVQMRSGHVAGTTVSVVRDGKLLFEKGYGYADLVKRTPVDPEQTLFRVGSVSKVFTWTAVMQLWQEGKLDPKATEELLDGLMATDRRVLDVRLESGGGGAVLVTIDNVTVRLAVPSAPQALALRDLRQQGPVSLALAIPLDDGRALLGFSGRDEDVLVSTRLT